MSEYRFWYYCLYAWGLKTWGPSDRPQQNAIVLLTMAATFNLGSAAMIASEFVFQRRRIPSASLAIASIAIYVLHYFFFMRGGRYLEIARAIASDPIQSNRPTWSGWLYVLWSLIFFVGLVAVLGPRNAA